MSNWKMALVNSVGVFVYVSIVAWVMTSGERWFGETDTVFTAMGVLLLFTLSAGVVGSLIVGKPIFMYLDGKKKEAVNMLIWTLAFLAIITMIVLIYLGIR